jgi:hypothetical protein
MTPASDHRARFSDSPQSLSTAVSQFIYRGLMDREPVLVVATTPHWALIRRECREMGIDVDAALRAGRLTVRDTEMVLSEVMFQDEPDPQRFDATAGELVRKLTGAGERIRVYGEAVDVLVQRNRFDAAERLEEFWNILAERERLEVLCSYSSEHFGNPRDAGSLQRICRLHAHVDISPDDVLARFLLKNVSAC